MIPRLALPAAVALCSVAALSGCRKHAPATGGVFGAASVVPSAAPSAAPPLDHLGNDELPPGTASAYGLVLPKGMKLLASFPRRAEAIGPVRPEEVANYVRDHVSSARIELGAVGTVFPAVRVKGGDPTKTLRIEVVPLGDRTKVIISDITPPGEHVAVDPSETDEMRWQKAGRNKDGTLRDPLKLR